MLQRQAVKRQIPPEPLTVEQVAHEHSRRNWQRMGLAERMAVAENMAGPAGCMVEMLAMLEHHFEAPDEDPTLDEQHGEYVDRPGAVTDFNAAQRGR